MSAVVISGNNFRVSVDQDSSSFTAGLYKARYECEGCLRRKTVLKNRKKVTVTAQISFAFLQLLAGFQFYCGNFFEFKCFRKILKIFGTILDFCVFTCIVDLKMSSIGCCLGHDYVDFIYFSFLFIIA